MKTYEDYDKSVTTAIYQGMSLMEMYQTVFTSFYSQNYAAGLEYNGRKLRDFYNENLKDKRR